MCKRYDISEHKLCGNRLRHRPQKKIPDLEIRYTMEHQTRLRSHLSTPARFALCIPAFYEGGKIGPVASQIYVITGSEGENANLIVQKTDTGLSLRSMTKAASSGCFHCHHRHGRTPKSVNSLFLSENYYIGIDEVKTVEVQ